MWYVCSKNEHFDANMIKIDWERRQTYKGAFYTSEQGRRRFEYLIR